MKQVARDRKRESKKKSSPWSVKLIEKRNTHFKLGKWEDQNNFKKETLVCAGYQTLDLHVSRHMP